MNTKLKLKNVVNALIKPSGPKPAIKNMLKALLKKPLNLEAKADLDFRK